MIISASYKTDIPAFYGSWLMERLRDGFCEVKNPYGGKLFRVDLTPDTVDGFVFWSRNFGPFLPHLAEIAATKPILCHFTIIGYPRAIDRSVIESTTAIDQAKLLRKLYGPRAVVWRYDPVILSSLTPASWHRENFARLAEQLSGVSDEVVFSFMQPYRKSIRNLNLAAAAHNFDWWDPEAEEKRALLSDLAHIASHFGFRPTLCTQTDLKVSELEMAACIDADRLGVHAKRKGNRPGCACAQSKDIGSYNSCPHGCSYCYAVSNSKQIRQSIGSFPNRSSTL